MSFETYLMRRFDEDCVEGFLARLIASRGGWMGCNPQSLREWVEEKGFDYKVDLCIDIAEVNWKQYLEWRRTKCGIQDAEYDSVVGAATDGK